MIPPGSDSVVENQAVTRAIHGLQTKLLLFHVDLEHVFRVVIPMTGRLPQLGIVNVGRDDFLETPFPVLFPDEFDETIVNEGSFGLEKTGSRTQFMEKEKLLFFPQFSVVSFGRLFLELPPFFELLVVRKGNPVDSLQGFSLSVALPVSSRVLGDLYRASKILVLEMQ